MITLADKRIPDFVKVNSVEFSVLPPITNNLLKVRGKQGFYNYGQDLDKRVFTVNFTIIAEKINGVMSASRTFAEWLYHTEPVNLIFDDEPDKYYKVLPDGDTNITEQVNIGQGAIQFVCVEPFAYGEEKFLNATMENSEPFYFEVGGNVETYPEIEITLKEDVDSVGLISDDSVVLIGEPNSADTKIKNASPTVLNDHMENVLRWSNGVTVDGGTVYGDMESTNGWGVVQKGGDYGKNPDGWHGAAKILSLDAPIQDFQVDMWLSHNQNNYKQMGRVELYLLDENNRHIGKMALVDNHPNIAMPVFEARAGDLNDGYYFAKNDSGAKKGQWKDFYGQIKITRKGNKWTAWIGQKSGSRIYNTRSYSWVDVDNKYKDKLASVQIHLGVHKDHNPTDLLQISRVMVKEFVSLSDDEAPYIAEAGDVLKIDCANSIVYKNDEVFYEGINPSSTFFSLKKGLNGLAVTSQNADIKVTFTERWL